MSHGVDLRLVSGAAHEITLYPGGRRLVFARLLLIGLGLTQLMGAMRFFSLADSVRPTPQSRFLRGTAAAGGERRRAARRPCTT